MEESGQLRVRPGKAPLSPLQKFFPEKQQIFLSPCQEFRVKSSKVQKGTNRSRLGEGQLLAGWKVSDELPALKSGNGPEP